MIEPILLKTKYEDVLLSDDFSDYSDILKCLEQIIGAEDIKSFLSDLTDEEQKEIIDNTEILSTIINMPLDNSILEYIDLPEPVSTTDQLSLYFDNTLIKLNDNLKNILFGNSDPGYPNGELSATLSSNVFEDIQLSTQASTCKQIQDYMNEQVNNLKTLINYID